MSNVDSMRRLVEVYILMFGRGVIGVGSGDCGEFGLGVGSDIDYVYGFVFGKGIEYSSYMSVGVRVG